MRGRAGLGIPRAGRDREAARDPASCSYPHHSSDSLLLSVSLSFPSSKSEGELGDLCD